MLKRSILIGSPSSPNFSIRGAKMEHLGYNVRLKGAECFSILTKLTKQKWSFATRATNFIIQTESMKKFHLDLKATMGKPI